MYIIFASQIFDKAHSAPCSSVMPVFWRTISRSVDVSFTFYKPHCDFVSSPSLAIHPTFSICSEYSVLRSFCSGSCVPFCVTHVQNRLQNVIVSRFLLNLRRSQQQPTPSRPSGIRSSMFHLPTLPDIVEDMGRPLEHGMRGPDARAEGVHDSGAAVAGPSFVQGSSTSAGVAPHRQFAVDVEGTDVSSPSPLPSFATHRLFSTRPFEATRARMIWRPSLDQALTPLTVLDARIVLYITDNGPSSLCLLFIDRGCIFAYPTSIYCPVVCLERAVWLTCRDFCSQWRYESEGTPHRGMASPMYSQATAS